ncbi:MAG: hypothetical protein ACLP4V_33515 [Methylocella sp.]
MSSRLPPDSFAFDVLHAKKPDDTIPRKSGHEAFGEFDQTLLVLIERHITRPADRKLFASLFGKLLDSAAASLKQPRWGISNNMSWMQP